MPAQIRRWISPTTGDYELASGGLRGDDGFASKAVLALRTKLGSMPVFLEFGSRLHEIKKADEPGRKLAEKYAYTAVKHLEDEVEDLTVTAVLSSTPGQIDIIVSGRRGATTYTANYSAKAAA